MFTSIWKSIGYEVTEHIATKVEVNPQMLSTFEKVKIHMKHGTIKKIYISVVGPLGIFVALVNRQIWQGCYKSGRFYRRQSMSTFLDICFSLVIETGPKC